MAWIYSAESADLPLGCDNTSERVPIVKTTDIAKLFYCPECMTAESTRPPYGITFLLSSDQCCPTSISSRADSHARISALREMESVWTARGRDYFLRLCESQANYDPDSCFWKTSQLSLLGGEFESFQNLPASGTTVGGQLFLPPNLEPRTLDDVGSYLPTPTATAYGTNQTDSPNAIVRPSLQTMAKLWPTPAARDWKDGLTPKQHGRHSDSVAVAVAVAKRGHNGYLNPAFVEVMMGYKIGWTACAGWATRWFRNKPKQRSND